MPAQNVLLFFALLTITPVSYTLANEIELPGDFIIEYVVENNIITAGKARYQLRSQPDSTYELSFETEPSGLFRLTRKGRIQEKANISIRNNQILPKFYTHTNISEPRRSFQIEFDLNQNRAAVTKESTVTDVQFPNNTIDRLSKIFSLMLTLSENPDVTLFTAPLLERNTVRNVTFQTMETELLETPIGTFSTTVLKKSRTNSNRYEMIWFARLAENRILYPVQFEQYKQNSLIVRLRLVDFQQSGIGAEID